MKCLEFSAWFIVRAQKMSPILRWFTTFKKMHFHAPKATLREAETDSIITQLLHTGLKWVRENENKFA